MKAVFIDGSSTLTKQPMPLEAKLVQFWSHQKDNSLLLLLNSVLIAQTIWQSMKHALWVYKAAFEFDAHDLDVFGDSLLIVSQTNGEWQARDPKFIPYQRYISQLIPKFKYVSFTYTPRAHNHFVDALSTLASLIKLSERDDVQPLQIETRRVPTYCVCIEMHEHRSRIRWQALVLWHQAFRSTLWVP